MSNDWTSVRIRRDTLERLKDREREDESHDEFLSRLVSDEEVAEA